MRFIRTTSILIILTLLTITTRAATEPICGFENYYEVTPYVSKPNPKDVTQKNKVDPEYCIYQYDSRVNNSNTKENPCAKVDIFLDGEDFDGKYCYLHQFRRKDQGQDVDGNYCYKYYISKLERPRLAKPKRFSYYIGVCANEIKLDTITPMGSTDVQIGGTMGRMVSKDTSTLKKTIDEQLDDTKYVTQDSTNNSYPTGPGGGGPSGPGGGGPSGPGGGGPSGPVKKSIKVVTDGKYGPGEISFCIDTQNKPNIGCKKYGTPSF